MNNPVDENDWIPRLVYREALQEIRQLRDLLKHIEAETVIALKEHDQDDSDEALHNIRGMVVKLLQGD